MTLALFGEHTLDTSLLQLGGWVLDAGCRDFSFAQKCAAHGCRVLAIDPDPAAIEDPKVDGVMFFRCAIGATRRVAQLVMTSDPQARHLDGAFSSPQAGVRFTVPVYTVEDLLQYAGTEKFCAVKLDIEGSEMEVLQHWPGPVADQISIEFHEHVQPRDRGQYNAIFAHLAQWYHVVQHEKTARHCLPPNHWDTLLTLK